MLKLHLQDIEHTLTTQQILNIANATENWSGSEMENLCRDCAMAPVRECIREVLRAERRLRRDSAQSDSLAHNEGQPPSQMSLVEQKFAALRPVNYNDFVDAVQLWTNRKGGECSPFAKRGFGADPKREHYDSSSEEEDVH
jgi:SpoVK/Ycf46/Vps4 family AAA+-type ATPase